MKCLWSAVRARHMWGEDSMLDRVKTERNAVPREALYALLPADAGGGGVDVFGKSESHEIRFCCSTFRYPLYRHCGTAKGDTVDTESIESRVYRDSST